MVTATGVHLLPASGEGAYDSLPMVAWQRGSSGLNDATLLNTFYAPGSSKTDLDYALDQLQAQHPECACVSVVCSWFFNSEDASQCNIYPSTNFLLGAFESLVSGVWTPTHWMVSGLTEQDYPGVIPLPALPGTTNFVYGGTPSDPSIVRCIQDLKSRGFRVVFYPFLLGTSSGFPWRGRIGYANDISSAATAAVNAFLGSASTLEFTRDAVNLTVSYSGYLYDWTYRRMILHYANLCVLAGGVDLFVMGSELRGLETIRGPTWTSPGTTDSNGNAIWDYPFVAGLIQLSDDVRSVFDGAGLTKNISTLKNLITYSADWSSWMGWQHPGANGQWPHLDQLWAHANIDLVSFDNYLPLSDWTTGNGGLDALNWSAPAYSGSWPPPASQLNGLGLSGPPLAYSPTYLKGNIEGGEFFDWFYNDGNNHGRGLDPNGSGLMVSLPEGDRLMQARNAYSANQQILAPKQLRWWWNNPHQAVYADAGGAWVPQGPQTEWQAQSKSIVMLEYGFAALDKATNQPNVFFDPKSTESFTPFWSIWDSSTGLSFLPRRDDTISAVALQAVYDYWNSDGHNLTSGSGLPMLQWTFCCVWNWDARPFPTFPIDSSAWGDTGNWRAGDWSNGLRTSLPPVAPTPPPTPGPFQTFPAIATVGWSVHVKPKFATDIADHVSGRSTRRARFANALFDVELTYEVLRSAAAYRELQAIAGFFEEMGGQATPFWFAPSGALGAATGQAIGAGDGATTAFALVQSIGAATLPVAGTSGVSAVYLNGVAQVSGWTVSSGYAPIVTFATAPTAGQAVTADFGVLWLCRFADDVQDFEEFVAQLFALRTLRLSTVRP
jgi:uncharacterized protein (TIGR02217 family)